MKSAPRVLVSNSEGKVPSEDLRLRGERNINMGLKCKINGICTGVSHSGQGPVYGPCEERDETSAFANCGNSLTK